jgi:hypothetical protein
MLGKHQAPEAAAPRPPIFTDPSVPVRACRCPARPTVKVIMPQRPGRAHPVDLWLCGHHYRASLAALLAVGATVEDLTLAADKPQADRDAAAPPQRHRAAA